jgi:hypothetical protein
MTEHAFLAGLLGFVILQVSFVGYLAYRAHRSAQQIEGLTAATFLEARKVLAQFRAQS